MANLIFSVLFLSVVSLASSSDCKLATDALKNYIKLDTDGKTTHPSKQVDRLVYSKGRDTAAFDSMTIVFSTKIKDCTKKNADLELHVNYNVLGILASNATKKELASVLSSKAKETTESFTMVKDGKSWKIDSSSILQPHIGINAAKNLIK